MAKGARAQRNVWTFIFSLLLTFSLVLLVLLALGIITTPAERFGPEGTSGAAISLRLPGISIMQNLDKSDMQDDDKSTGNRPWVEFLSWEPRVFIYHNFLSKEECEYMINLGKPKMTQASVVDSTTGKSKPSSVRTSSGAFLYRGQDKIVRAIEKRISDFSFIPAEHGEGLQILHYEAGQKYDAHFDYFHDDQNVKNGGQRIATVLLYLKFLHWLRCSHCFNHDITNRSNVEAGGETVFPSVKVNASTIPWWNELSECGKRGLSVRPKQGNALIFWSLKPDASVDQTTLHAGCPVISGHKWSATKWLRVREYKMS